MREVRSSDQRLGLLVRLGTQRQLSVSEWLLAAAAVDIKHARVDWADRGIALMRCGSIFAAVRIPAEMVHAAAGAEDRDRIDIFLGEVLEGGPVFIDASSQRYYVLVHVSTEGFLDEIGALAPDVEWLGSGTYLGVPDPMRHTQGGIRSYWCVPMYGPGVLCSPNAVARLIALGRRSLPVVEREGADEPDVPAGR